MKIKFLNYLLIPAIISILASCMVSREDLYDLASIKPVPNIEVKGYPNKTGIYNFESVEVYTSNIATFTIENTGSGNLLVKGLSFLEDGVTWFTIDTSSIVSVVAPGTSTTFTIKFKPTSNTHESVTVILLSNVDDKSPYTFTVEGSGFGVPEFTPDINVKQGTTDIPNGLPLPVDFGTIEVGTSSLKVFTIENNDTGELSVFDITLTRGTGTERGEFSVIAPSIPASLAECDSTIFTIMFSPQATGNKSATITILNDDPDENPYTFTVQGDGSAIPEPDINVKQGLNDLANGSGSYDFGYVQLGTSSSPVTFTMENNGTNILNISSIDFTFESPSGQFTIDNAPLTPPDIIVNPQSSTIFTITFSPNLGEEYKEATVTINNDDPDESLYTFKVEGWGLTSMVPNITVTEAPYDSIYDFGPVLLGESKTETITIQNTGTGDLNILSVINKDPDKFTLDDTTVSPIPPFGGSTTFEITFTPIDTGALEATIEIHSDDMDTDPYKFKVKAHGSEGPEPDIAVKLDGNHLPNDFTYYLPATLEGNSSAPVIFTIENRGTGDLNISSILFTGDIEHFVVDYDPGSLTIPPGNSLLVTVWFAPKEDGDHAAKLEIMSNDPDEDKYIIKLEGEGI